MKGMHQPAIAQVATATIWCS